MEKERERNISAWFPLMHPLLGTWPTTQACAPTGDQISDPLVHRPPTRSTELHQPGQNIFLIKCYPTSGNISEGTQNINAKEHKHPYVHCSVMYHHQGWKQPRCPSVERWIKHP